MINPTATTIQSQLSQYPAAQSLLATSLTWMSKHYDDRVGLLRAPGSSAQEHLVRESIWYALGLAVTRIHDPDADPEQSSRISDIVGAVLKAQWDTPGTTWHGTFRRNPLEPDPPADAKIWRDYDPNWRQFIGTVLILLLRLEGDGLLADHAQDMRYALQLCVTGEPADRVPASYTNIALMKAWLEIESAALIGVGNTQRGLDFGREIADGFNQHRSFAEYNSPTYYGINLYALGLWQHYSTESELERLGEQLSGELWRDIADFYHPLMKNLCGPFSRAYGMDMQQYVAALGLWIWSLSGEEEAPFPMAGLADGTMDHAHDFALGPLAAITASSPAPEVVERFRRLPADTMPATQHFSRIITDTPSRRVQAWITPELMVGLESSQVSYRGNPQYHPFTVHWLEGRELRWLRLRFSGRLQGALQPGYAQLTLIPDDGVQDCVWQSSHPIQVSGGNWCCGHLTMSVDTESPCKADGDRVRMKGLIEQTNVHITFTLNGATG